MNESAESLLESLKLKMNNSQSEFFKRINSPGKSSLQDKKMITNIDYFGGNKKKHDNLLAAKIVQVDLEALKIHLSTHGDDNTAAFFLAEDERIRFSSFRYEKRKIEWLGGRIAAKCSALQLMNRSSETYLGRHDWIQVKIEADSHGKPSIVRVCEKKGLNPFISISHSSGIAVGMASWISCGIDIQKITPRIENVASRFALDEELVLLRNIIAEKGKPAALTILWAAKEAIKKGTLEGPLPGFMEMTLHSLHIDSSDIILDFLRIDKEQSEQSVKLRIQQGFALAFMRVQGEGK